MLERINVFQKAIACYLTEWLNVHIMMHYSVHGLDVLQVQQRAS